MVFLGEVKSVSAQYAFIACADTFALYNRDIFVMPTSYPPSGLRVGDRVRFALDMQSGDRPRAKDIENIPDELSSPTSAGASDVAFEGEVKSVSAQYAFISCADTFAH